MAKEGSDLSGLPPTSLFQSSDVVHGVETGFIIGGLSGLIGSIIAISALQLGSEMGLIVLGCTLFGAGFGVWTSGMMGSSTKKTGLKGLEKDMDDGKILLITDVPVDKVNIITSKIRAHKEAIMGGSEPSMPAFL